MGERAASAGVRLGSGWRERARGRKPPSCFGLLARVPVREKEKVACLVFEVEQLRDDELGHSGDEGHADVHDAAARRAGEGGEERE